MTDAGQTHYIAMAGLRGTMPNYCSVHPDIYGAVDSLLQICDPHSRKARLVEIERDLHDYHYVDLDLRTDGNEYAEITTCDCNTPWIHDETMTKEQWREDND